MTSLVSARELAEREKKRLDVKKATYRAILEQFSRKISNAATLGKHELMLTTPQFMIGYPVYDVASATAYIQRQLDRLGYKTRRALPQVIHVSWKKATPSRQSMIIDHSAEEDLPALTNLAKTAQTLRSRRSSKK